MDISTLLKANTSSNLVAITARVALQQCYPYLEFPIYFATMDRALKNEPPPFNTKGYADIYQNASADKQWMAISLIANAEREGDGAKRLWSLAACSDNLDEQRKLKSHAVDESRHALLYLALLDLTFPNAASPSFRMELDQLSPRYSIDQDLFAVQGSPYAKKPIIDDFIQMNVAEIRTTIHHIMQRTAIAEHCPPDNLRRIILIQDSLLRDELQHVAYTAALIECIARASSLDKVSKLFIQRFRDFNQITREELGNKIFDCSVACCEKRTWCRTNSPIAPPKVQ
jgi:hypothetical protein